MAAQRRRRQSGLLAPLDHLHQVHQRRDVGLDAFEPDESVHLLQQLVERLGRVLSIRRGGTGRARRPPVRGRRRRAVQRLHGKGRDLDVGDPAELEHRFGTRAQAQVLGGVVDEAAADRRRRAVADEEGGISGLRHLAAVEVAGRALLEVDPVLLAAFDLRRTHLRPRRRPDHEPAADRVRDRAVRQAGCRALADEDSRRAGPAHPGRLDQRLCPAADVDTALRGLADLAAVDQRMVRRVQNDADIAVLDLALMQRQVAVFVGGEAGQPRCGDTGTFGAHVRVPGRSHAVLRCLVDGAVSQQQRRGTGGVHGCISRRTDLAVGKIGGGLVRAEDTVRARAQQASAAHADGAAARERDRGSTAVVHPARKHQHRGRVVDHYAVRRGLGDDAPVENDSWLPFGTGARIGTLRSGGRPGGLARPGRMRHGRSVQPQSDRSGVMDPAVAQHRCRGPVDEHRCLTRAGHVAAIEHAARTPAYLHAVGSAVTDRQTREFGSRLTGHHEAVAFHAEDRPTEHPGDAGTRDTQSVRT